MLNITNMYSISPDGQPISSSYMSNCRNVIVPVI